MVKGPALPSSRMADADRGEGGRYASRVTDEEILASLDYAPGPVVTAAELEEVLPIGRRAIRERLLDFLDDGRVDRKKVGGRAVVWWRTSRDDADGVNGNPFENDPVFELPTFASGAGDVSANVDEYVADAIAGESEPNR